MKYPFEFRELLLDSTLLDRLGFTTYWGNPDDSGERDLRFGEHVFSVTIFDQKDDETDGYTSWGQYTSETIGLGHRHSHLHIGSRFHRLYFLHDLHDAIKEVSPNILPHFLEKCEEHRMKQYIDCYLEHKNKIDSPISRLVEALNNDLGYRQGWIANIAMSFKDQFTYNDWDDYFDRPTGFKAVETPESIHEKANKAAEAFINMLCRENK